MKKTLLTITAGLFFSANTLANDLEFSFTEDSVAARYFSTVTDSAAVELGGSHNRDDDRSLIDAGVFVFSPRSELQGQVGVKLFYTDLDRHEDGYGLAFGGDGQLQLNSNLSLYAGAYYSPSATAFSDIEGYRQFFVGASLALFENALVSLGFSDLHIKSERRNKVEIEDGLQLKMRLKF